MTKDEAINHLQTHSTTNGSGMTTDKQHEEAKRIAIEALTNSIPIPEGATNGDMIKAMFPNISIYEHGSTYSVNNEYNFNSTWWNKPYKAESEDKE